MPENRPQVSIIIPAYHAESTIQECLEALNQQSMTRDNYEIIVIDDGSKDRTASIAEQYADRVIKQENAGPAMARNKGVSLARGEIILFTDADCTAQYEFVEEMLKPLNNPAVVGVKGCYRTKQSQLWARFAQVEFEERYKKLARSESIDFVDSHAAAFRIDVFNEVGGFDPHFPVANNEDVDLSYKIARLGYRMIFNPKAIVYHVHPDTFSKYLRTKFLRAYWRMLVYRRFPEKILSDTYTPQTMKLQIVFVALLCLGIVGSLFHPVLWKALPFLLGGFVLSSLPFIYRALKTDPKITLFCMIALLFRSFVFGLGVSAGFLAQRRRDLLIPALLVITDVVTALGAYSFAFWIRSVMIAPLMRPFDHTFTLYISIFPLALLLWLGAFHSLGLYKANTNSAGIDEFAKVTRGITFSVFGIITLSYLGKWDFSRGFIIMYWCLALVCDNLLRHTVRLFQARIRQKGLLLIRTLIVGIGDTGQLVIKSLKDHPTLGVNIIGVADDRMPAANENQYNLPFLGTLNDLEEIIIRESIDEVYIARPDMKHQEILDIVVRCEKTGAGFKIVSDLASIVTGGAGLSPIAGLPVIDLKEEKNNWGRQIIKRITDLILTVVFLILLSPLLLLLGLIVHFSVGGSILTAEERVGKDGRLFKMYRFRKSPPGHVTGSRATYSWVGKFFEKTYLDELPQLVNVLRSEMSLVGPRPEVPEIVATYAAWQRKRLEVKPGITGLWQIITPGDRPLHEDLEYDFYYIKNYNIWMDLGLMLRTIPIILFGKGNSNT